MKFKAELIYELKIFNTVIIVYLFYRIHNSNIILLDTRTRNNKFLITNMYIITIKNNDMMIMTCILLHQELKMNNNKWNHD